MKVPFLDLHAQYVTIKNEIDRQLEQCLETSSFIGGQIVSRFEKEFADYLGVKHCVTCANGTDALEILLKALGIGPGDEVLVPALTWISTAEAVNSVGAQPVFVDIHPDYYTIDPSKIEACITEKTKAIIPVHLYGLPCEMDEILAIAKKYRLKILEDCAQAHGATYKGKMVGALGDAAAFSFYPGKNLGAYGDGGCMVTSHDEIARQARLITNHGQPVKHDHQIHGRNSRLDTIQAAVLGVKLKYLDRWNHSRRAAAARYKKLLEGTDIKLPVSPEYSGHVYHLFVVQVSDREALQNALSRKGIETAVHYPKALPFVKAYAYLNHQTSDFPVSAAAQSRILSLPIYAELTDRQIDYVAENLLSCSHQSSKTAAL
ncbi:MAG: hypothetical protein KatS3mg031_1165 [Chitinophagales bacterium]|nr:MAG: hypothetical protein KatS3mg031_1165 [Chitinophagales bacterium]